MLNRFGIQGNRRIEKVTDELHPFRIIPNIDRHNATCFCYPCHLCKSTFGVRNEIENETRDNSIEGFGLILQHFSIPHIKMDSSILHTFSRKIDKAFGAINSFDSRRFSKLKDCLAQRPCPTTHIQPSAARRHSQPSDKLTRHAAAPASHITFI
jgi:hypothetical protein